MVINIALIANNYGKQYDGVGNYAQIMVDCFSEDIDVTVFTADCATRTNKILRVLNWGMTRQIYQAAVQLKKNPPDVLLLEYPFTEFNVAILIALHKLLKTLPTKVPFVLSLHEYERLNPLARMIANNLCKMADAVMVTTLDCKKAVSLLNSTVIIRKIPSNIYDAESLSTQTKRFRNNYAYFGTINKMKAIPELLEAWKIFNAEKDKTLYILTATDIGDVEQRFPGVIYIKGASASEILKVMRKCAFSIVPIRPYVDEKNTTFFTSCIAGCVTIAKFCEKYSNLSFVENISDYKQNTLLGALKKTVEISEAELYDKCERAQQFGACYIPQNVADELIKVLSETIKSKDIHRRKMG